MSFKLQLRRKIYIVLEKKMTSYSNLENNIVYPNMSKSQVVQLHWGTWTRNPSSAHLAEDRTGLEVPFSFD